MPTPRFLVVLPVLRYDLGSRCLRSIVTINNAAGFDPADVLIVSNGTPDDDLGIRHGWIHPDYLRSESIFRYHRDPGGHNLGVARSWNVGARLVLDEGLDYLVLLSASLEFGPLLHASWADRMRENNGCHVIEATGHSWHLIAIHRTVFEEVGLFDENFYPAYQEAIDFGYRMRMVGLERGFGNDRVRWANVWVNALSHGSANHIDTVSCPAQPLLDYYAAKWGGPKGEETHSLPWGGNPIDYWPEYSIPDLAVDYGLETWW